MKKIDLIAVIIVLLTSIWGEARSIRVNQIPNGGVFGCANCHINSSGGGERTKFGDSVNNSFLDGSGNVMWGASLAAIDSDEDGKTNGEELQDPSGEWSSGSAQPGDVNLVSNPGDPQSTTGISIAAVRFTDRFQIKQNYPNPFNPSTTISFSLPHSTTVTLHIYNSLGHAVRNLINAYLPAGEHAIVWNGCDDDGEALGSGVYFVRLENDGEADIKRILMIR